MGEKSRFLTLTKIWQKQPPRVGDAKAYQVNVTDDESVSSAINQIAEDFGAIHINVIVRALVQRHVLLAARAL